MGEKDVWEAVKTACGDGIEIKEEHDEYGLATTITIPTKRRKKKQTSNDGDEMPDKTRSHGR